MISESLRRLAEAGYEKIDFEALPESDWTAPRIADLPTLVGKTGLLGIDTETKDPRLLTHGPGFLSDGRLLGYSFAIEGGPKHYVPLYHLDGNVEDPDQAIRWARDNFAGWEGQIVGANIGYDLGYLRANGIRFTHCTGYKDVQIAEPLLNEYGYYALMILARKYLGVGKSEDLMDKYARAIGMPPKKIKANMDLVPARYIGPYGEDDADLPVRIIRLQEAEISNQGLDNVYRLESELIPLFHEMKWRGVPVNVEKLHRFDKRFEDIGNKCYEIVQRHTGVYIGDDTIWKPKMLVPILSQIGIDCPERQDGSPSVTKELLSSHDHVVTRAILRARQMQKYRSTFVGGLKSHLVGNRIHPNYNQLPREKEEGSNQRKGTVSGRPSMENPNLLNQPARDPKWARLWRTLFDARIDGALWSKADYSSQEPRMSYHLASVIHDFYLQDPDVFWDCEMPGIEDMVQAYHENPLTDCHQMTANLTKVKRKDAKAIYLGTTYGMGTGKLARSLGLPTRWVIPPYWDVDVDPSDKSTWPPGTENEIPKEIGGKETMEIRNKFNKNLPFLMALRNFMENRLKSKKFIKTVGGRRCRMPMSPHKALNRAVQGSSADQTKEAMLLVWKELGIVPYLQIYDELGSPVADESQAVRIAELMEDAVQLRLPTVVEPYIGNTWGSQTAIKRECYAQFVKTA